MSSTIPLNDNFRSELVRQRRHDSYGVAFICLIAFLLCMVAMISHMVPVLEAVRPAQLLAISALVTGLFGKMQRREPLVHCAPTYLLFVFLGFAAITVPWSLWPRQSAETMLDAFKILAIFLLISNLVTTKKKLTAVAWALSIGGLAPALGSIRYYFSGAKLVEGFRTQWVGIYLNPNDLAYAMAMLVPLALALTFTARSKLAKLVALGAIGAYIFSIFLTFSRMGFLCLSIIVLMTLLRSQQRVRNFALISIIILLFLPFVPSRYWERTSTIATYDKDVSSLDRIEAWKAGIDMVTRYPLFGVGAGCYQLGWEEKSATGHQLTAHNTFFQALGELGMVGFTSFCSFLLVSWWIVWSLRSSLKRERQVYGEAEFQKRFGTLLIMVTALDIGFWVFTVSSLTGGLLFTWYPYIFSALAIAAREIYKQQLSIAD